MGNLLLVINKGQLGDELVETLTKCKAPLYICCSEVNSEIDSDIDLPEVGFLKVNNGTFFEISLHRLSLFRAQTCLLLT